MVKVCMCVALIAAATASVDAQVATEVDRLFPAGGTDANAFEFGRASAIGGGYIAVSSPDDDSMGSYTGAVYLFDAQTRAQVGKLVASDASQGAQFGEQLLIHDGKLFVGVPQEGSIQSFGGAVYVFDLQTRSELMKIVPSDLTPDAGADISFGESLSIADGKLAVSAVGSNGFAGALYIFDIATGDELMKISPADGVQNDLFGRPVAMGGGYIAAGTRADPNDAVGSSIYIYSSATGEELRRITPEVHNTSFVGDDFEIADGILYVGDIFCGDAGMPTGCVRLFDLSTGAELGRLVDPQGTSGDDLGRNISVSNGKLVAGALRDRTNGLSSGSVCIFDLQSRSIIEKVVPASSEPFLAFGSSVAIEDETLVVGAQGVSSTGFIGSAFVFDLSFACSAADFDGSGDLNFFDVSRFIEQYLAGNPAADINGDGALNNFDVSEFIKIFNMGCP